MAVRPIIVSLAFMPVILLVGMVIWSEVKHPRPTSIVHFKHIPLYTENTFKPLVDRLQMALRIKTITKYNQDYDKETLVVFADFLRKSFPTIYSSPFVSFETINNYSLLYFIKGSDASLKPYLLCAHIDVVPAEEDKWEVDPFGGILKNGFIYGRGTFDDKCSLMAIMEALEHLLKDGFKPKRSFFIAFGHDKEGQGLDGAQEIGKVFASRKIKFEFILDEGMAMLNNSKFIPGITKTIAIVAVSEKGFLTIKLSVNASVGHTSMSSVETSVTTLSRAVSKLTGLAHPKHLDSEPLRTMFKILACHSHYPYKLVYSNFWFFRPIINKLVKLNIPINIMVRTTSFATAFVGGFKEITMPGHAEAMVSHRIHPAEKIKDVIQYNKQLIKDRRVKIEINGSAFEAHPISPFGWDSFGYQTIKKSIKQVFLNTIVVPGILISSSDTKWYLNFTNSIYHYSPEVINTKEDLKRYHGHNERISVSNYMQMVAFYRHIYKNADNKIFELKNTKDEL